MGIAAFRPIKVFFFFFYTNGVDEMYILVFNSKQVGTYVYIGRLSIIYFTVFRLFLGFKNVVITIQTLVKKLKIKAENGSSKIQIKVK